MKAQYQISLIKNDGTLVEVIKCNHIDGVRSHTVIYVDEFKECQRIFDTLHRIQILPGKIILYYENCLAEIVKIR